jgi:amino acid adenylation domain-containing protein
MTNRRLLPFELTDYTSHRLQEMAGVSGAIPAVSIYALATVLAACYSYWDTVTVGMARPAEGLPAVHGAGDVAVVPLTVSVEDDPPCGDVWDRVRAAIPPSRLESVLRPGDGGVECHLQLPSQPRLLIAPAGGREVDGEGDVRLAISCRLSGPRIVGTLDYDERVFDRVAADRLCTHFVRTAAAVAANPGVRVSSLEIIDDNERRTLLHDWNAAPRGYPEGTAHELFRRQAERTPDAAALVDRERAISYRELNARVNQLAHHLRARGVDLEVPVGVSLERSADAVIVVLAILKAGGMFVPLDPGFPRSRLEEMIHDAALTLVVTRDEFRPNVPIDDPGIVSLDRDSAAIAMESNEEPPAIGCQDNAAYLLYTSGSTGRPKAIVGIHRSIVNGACAAPFHAGDLDDVCCLNSSLSFGFTISRLFLPLFFGHTLVIIPDGQEKDLGTLVTAWDRAGVGNIALVTPLLKQLLDGGQDVFGRLRRVRTVAVGGSMVARSTIAAFIQAMPHATLIHGYASTEVGTAALIHTLTRDAAANPWSVGIPFPNTTAYVLGRHLQLMPPGAVGELCLGAPHMARAYLHRPDLTAHRFVPNPFEPGARLLRTGDLARHLPSGEIEILGRTDDQVKIRGFRIELTEVESRLAEHPDVRFAATAAKEINGEPRLVAYVGRTHDTLTAGVLRTYLVQRLPEYMVPAMFMFVESLPLTGIGKVDRAALPLPAVERRGDEAYVASRTAFETELAAIWSAVLGIECVGANDDFLDLGGDSLHAMEIAVRVKAVFGVDIPAVALASECGTVGALAERIAALMPPRTETEAAV